MPANPSNLPSRLNTMKGRIAELEKLKAVIIEEEIGSHDQGTGENAIERAIAKLKDAHAGMQEARGAIPEVPLLPPQSKEQAKG